MMMSENADARHCCVPAFSLQGVGIDSSSLHRQKSRYRSQDRPRLTQIFWILASAWMNGNGSLLGYILVDQPSHLKVSITAFGL